MSFNNIINIAKEKYSKIITMPELFNCTLKNYPFIENDFDAVTMYQLYTQIVSYLNNVINIVNEQTENLGIMENNINNVYSAFTDLNTYLNSSLNQLEDDFNARLENIESRLDSVDSDLSDINNEFRAHVINNNNNFKALENKDNAQQELINTNTSNIAINTNSINSIKTDNTEMNRKINLNAANITNLQLDMQRVNENLNTLNSSTIELQNTVNTHSTQINTLNTLTSSHTTEINNLNTTSDIHTTSINSLNSDVQNINASLSSISTQINTLNTLTSSHTTEINNLNTTSDIHTTSINSLNSDVQNINASLSSISTQVELNTSDITSNYLNIAAIQDSLNNFGGVNYVDNSIELKSISPSVTKISGIYTFIDDTKPNNNLIGSGQTVTTSIYYYVMSENVSGNISLFANNNINLLSINLTNPEPFKLYKATNSRFLPETKNKNIDLTATNLNGEVKLFKIKIEKGYVATDYSLANTGTLVFPPQ